MGSVYSSFDQSTNQAIFCPPNTPHHLFNNLIRPKVSDFVMQDTGVPCLLIQSNNSLYGCELKYIKNRDKCIIFSHGNGCDIYTMYNHMKQMADLLETNIYIYDYPGYGLANNTSYSEKGCYDNLKKVIDYVRIKYEDTDITLIGHSLGTGVVMDYVSKYNWKTPIILISPYKSMGRILTDSSSCTALQSIDKFGTYYKLDTIECPVKIFHGSNDKLINISHAKDLYENLKNKSLKPTWLEGIGHNNILESIDSKEIIKVMDPTKL